MSTPFSFVPGSYPGARPEMTTAPVPLLGSGRPWLGRVGSAWGMVELPSPPPDGYQITPPNSGESAHRLIGGGTATTYFPNNRARAWVLSWPALELRDQQVIDGFYARAFGKGPWAFVNPEGRNRLTRVQSLCGDASVWATTGGTLAVDAAPGFIAPSGSLLWTPSAAGKLLGAGSLSGGYILPDVSRSPVVVPAEPFTAYFYAQAPSGTAQVATRVVGKAETGPGITTLTGPTITVGTSWQQVAVVAAPGAFDPTALYLVQQLQSVDGNPVRVSCPMSSYTDEVVDWGMGEGVPRVVCPQSADVSEFVDEYDMTRTLALAESITGAC